MWLRWTRPMTLGSREKRHRSVHLDQATEGTATARLSSRLEGRPATTDAVVVDGIWQYQSAAVARWARRARTPYFVFVHGALDPSFRRRYPLSFERRSCTGLFVEIGVLRDAAALTGVRRSAAGRAPPSA